MIALIAGTITALREMITILWGLQDDGTIVHRQEDRWQPVEGRLAGIAVGSIKHIWGVNDEGMIYRWDGEGWRRIEGRLPKIAVGSDGTVWGMDGDGFVHRIARR